MEKGEQLEASDSHKIEILWEELDQQEISEVLLPHILDYQKNLQHLYRSSDKSAVRVFQFGIKPRDEKIMVVMEKSCSFKEWIEKNRPTVHNLLIPKNFLYPLRSLIECVYFLKKKFGDFSFDVSDIIVSNSECAPRLKILCIDEISSTDSLTLCGWSIVKVIKFWFGHYNIDIENHKDLQLLVECLQNLNTFRGPPMGRILILTIHPVFYTLQERALLFDMVQLLDTKVGINFKGKHNINVDIVGALNLIHKGYYSLSTMWYEDAKRRGIWANTAIESCYYSRRRDWEMRSFLHNIRNLAVHVRGHFWRGDSMNKCALNLEAMVPGCFSAIFHIILVHGLQDHFLATSNS